MSKKIRINKRRRVCRFSGCKHVLSVYNPESYCYVHQQVEMERQIFSSLYAKRF